MVGICLHCSPCNNFVMLKKLEGALVHKEKLPEAGGPSQIPCCQSMSTGRNSLPKPHVAEQPNSNRAKLARITQNAPSTSDSSQDLHSKPLDVVYSLANSRNYLCGSKPPIILFLRTSRPTPASPAHIHYAHSTELFRVAVITPLARMPLRCFSWCLFAPVLLHKGAA